VSAPVAGPRLTGGLRRETPLLLAGALAVFVALEGFTLLGYRGAIERFASDRRAEAESIAARIAREAQRRGHGRIEELAPLAPPGSGLALFDAQGTVLDAIGFAQPPTLAVAGLTPQTQSGAAAVGPLPGEEAPIVALAPFVAGGVRRYVRLDLATPALAAERRGLAWLTPAVLGLSVGAALVVLLFLRALSRPYEALLARAREAGAPVDGRDELAGLVATFDRALAALAPGRSGLDGLREALGSDLDGGFLLLDREGTLLAATPAAAELLDLPALETGAPVARALADRPELAALLERTVRGGEPLPRGAVRIERRDHGEREATLGVTAEPLRGEGGRPRGWLVVVADLTEIERHAARERLAEGLAQLGELSAGVAHELRNSLATLSGWVALARRSDLPEGAAEALAEIARETEQISRVVADFLAFARPGTRRLDTLELAAVVARAAADPRLEDPGVKVRTAGAAPFTGDAELLERALRNLLLNAVEAQRTAGRSEPVVLALGARGEDWEITVDDRGGGLPEEVRAHLFEPFTSGRAGGAGLGLALARRIVVLHGGSLSLEDLEGGGTRARMLLPRVQIVTEGSNSAADGASDRSWKDS
jgi:signal transduction histidine kinase